MDKSESVKNPDVDQLSNKGGKAPSLFFSFVREALAIVLWGYVTVKLFIFDIDIYLVDKYIYNYKWAIDYKFFFLIGIIATIWLITKNNTVLSWSLFIFFYPLILFLWKIPSFVFKKKSWNFVFVYADSIIAFFKSLKMAFIATSFFLVSTVVVLRSSNQTLLWFSVVVLTVILFWVYLQKIILIVRPSGIYQVYSKFFLGLGKFVREYKNPYGVTDENDLILPINIDSMSEKKIERWISDVYPLILFNKACLFVAKKMRAYQESGFNTLSSVFSLLLLVLYTVISFAIINFGIHKINPYFYSYSVAPIFFDFFYYSFSALVFNQIQDLVAIAPMAQAALMVEYFYAFFLAAILVSLVLSIRNQRNIDELNETIKNMAEEASRIEGFVKIKYGLENTDIALKVLEKLKASAVNLINTIVKETE